MTRSFLGETPEHCFICAARIGRGNHPHIGAHERMNKLASVSQTVEHARSPIMLLDMLSRILNEAVMHEEMVCRICFNLLSDIDYHLKEAQEKTDEITNKFHEKNNKKKPEKRVKRVVIEEETTEDDEDELPAEETRRSARKRRGSSKRIQEDPLLTEDEMSVNTINRNKAKLLSHVLNPKKMMSSSRHDQEVVDSSEDDDEEDDTEDDEKEVVAAKKPKVEEARRESGNGSSELNEEEHVTSGSFRKQRDSNQQFVTVNMDDLGEMLTSNKTYYAKKSEPTPAATAASELSVQCQHCNKSFKKKTNLQLHIEKVHATQPAVIPDVPVPETHKCKLCPREFTNERTLLAHSEEHQLGMVEQRTAPVAKPARANEGEVKATCQQCGKTFRRHFNMRIHVDRVHNKVRPFPCKSCDKAFATNSDLKQHMTTHGEGKTFECEECGRMFTNRDSIILHRKQHTNERTHFCVICKKGFFKASCLSRHMRTHTGERPYPCQYCNKGFSQSTTLKVHVAKCPRNPAVKKL